uniref:DUF211 domain-containing protein n=1 Tax=Ignisphaera aggregans TaxID=334771 RepID=A0A7C4JJT2_9CREN
MIRLRIVRLVLEVSRPVGSLDAINLIKRLTELSNVKSVTVKFRKISARAQTLLLALEGDNLDYEHVSKMLSEFNITIMGIDEIQALSK